MNTGKTYTTAEFIQKAIAKHGERYDYALTEYRGKHQKITVVCMLHGAFEQMPGRHLSTIGCCKCAALAKGEAQRKPLSEFISAAEAVHGVGVYDYSRVIYTGLAAKVTIICPTHGPFEQKAGAHIINGHNCPQCADRRATLAGFIDKARTVHGLAYDYSQAEYKNVSTKLTIICPTHGAFEQKPNGHLNGAGCWPCANERIKAGWIARAGGRECTLYLVRFFDKTEEFFKVGVTYRGVKARFATANLSGYKREVLATCTSKDAARIYDWERSIIRTFARLQHKPKRWFDGATECFSSCEEILEIFPL